MNEEVNICYLCGSELKDDIDRDHVPPKQFYATTIRKTHSLNLFRLPVHKSCNKGYQKDEDYFVHSIAPLTINSYSGKAIWNDIKHQFKRPEGKRIQQMIYKEFDPRPSGLYLPRGKVLKRFDPERVWCIIWKITRGLFFKEYGRFLPEDKPRHIEIISADEPPPPKFAVVRDTPSRGSYPEVFDYKYIMFPELNNFHFWAMLFWDKLITLIAFHDPECICEKCIEAPKE
jgi:hypothetical protein